jgi:hypothetical protein
MGVVRPENSCMQNYLKYSVTIVGHEVFLKMVVGVIVL